MDLAIAMDLALALAMASALASALEMAMALDLALAMASALEMDLAMDLALDLEMAMAMASALAMDLALALAMAMAKKITPAFKARVIRSDLLGICPVGVFCNAARNSILQKIYVDVNHFPQLFVNSGIKNDFDFALNLKAARGNVSLHRLIEKPVTH